MQNKFDFNSSSTPLLEDVLHVLRCQVVDDISEAVASKRYAELSLFSLKPSLCRLIHQRVRSIPGGARLEHLFLLRHFIKNNRWWKRAGECYWVDAYLAAKHDESHRWYYTTEENRQEALDAWGKWATGQVRGMIKALEGVIASRKK